MWEGRGASHVDRQIGRQKNKSRTMRVKKGLVLAEKDKMENDKT